VSAQGLELPPVAKTGYWTDRASNDSRFWPHHYEPRFYPCDARSVRGVCFGFPALDLPARNAEVPRPASARRDARVDDLKGRFRGGPVLITKAGLYLSQRRACSCRARDCAAVRPRAMRRPLTSPAAAAQCQNRRVYGVCDDWPHIEYAPPPPPPPSRTKWTRLVHPSVLTERVSRRYAVPPDPARCRAGYTGARRAARTSHELRQCAPPDADAENGFPPPPSY